GARSGGQPGPAHGFARTSAWTMEGRDVLEDGKVELVLSLRDTHETDKSRGGAFHLRLRVTIGSELEMELATVNQSDQPFSFEQALHTYLAVGDIHKTSISGLENTVFIDKTDGFKRKTRDGGPVRITGETDAVHLNTQSACTISDPEWSRRI